MTIRPAREQDYKDIKKLIRRHPRQLMQSPLPRLSDFYVTLEKGKIIGCCALEVYSKRLAEVRSLVVDKRYRGRGAATKLVKACLGRAKKFKIYEVLSITSAMRLFSRLGFRTFNKEKYALLKVL